MSDELTARRVVQVRERGGGWLAEQLADPEFRRVFEEELAAEAATDTHSPDCSIFRGCQCPESNTCWHAVACDCGGDDRELVHVEVR